ncbi:MAG: SynChlorMet cassette protein ScmC [Anaerolineales bacterium]|nr:SynChlorMet cassette protein ScmC [Anaerolineales bacterium]
MPNNGASPREDGVAACYRFRLGNGARWYVAAGDPAAESVVAGLASVMNLAPAPMAEADADGLRKMIIFSAPPDPQPEVFFCVLPRPRSPEYAEFDRYTAISHALALVLLRDGAVLLHGALAEYRFEASAGKGVVFSASGGTGKTTVSLRLTAPWRSLSDDAALVVPSGEGGYRAHPWPTWSTFFYADQAGGIWDVQASTPLCACVFLKRAERDSLEPLGAGHAAALLSESARQINALDARLPPAELRPLRRVRFEAVCGLARAVPAHLLRVSLEGEFWREVERVLK